MQKFAWGAASHYCVRRMRLIDRYLLKELLVPLGFCLAGFLIFWITFDLFSELDDFHENQLAPLDIAEYYLVRTPEFLVTVMPVALLLAVLYALTTHARHHELIAIRSAGVGVARLSLPYFCVALLFSLGLFALNELLVPQSAELAEKILTQKEREKNAESDRWVYNLNFRNAREGRIWNIGAFHLDHFEMRNPQVEWNLSDGTSRRLIAQSAVRTNGVWRFYKVQEIIYREDDERFEPETPRREVLDAEEFNETPEQIKSEIKVSQLSSVKAARKVQLSVEEIIHYIRLHPVLTPRDHALLNTQLHARLAAPWTCVVVVLIALPFGISAVRRNVFVGVAASILITFTFFILLRLGLALGTGGHLPPWLAAWFPNLLFGGIGFWLTRRVR